jgi:magnesium-transporting ATPase (P-type)
MTLLAFQKLEFNKEIINLFSVGIVILLSIIGFIGGKQIFTEGFQPVSFRKVNMYESFLLFFFVLAGHDALIKFTEETKNPSNIDKSMYYSIIVSIILTIGVCLACLYYIDFKNDKIENALALIFDRGILNGSGKYITTISLIFMIVTSFVGYLATTRYLYRLEGFNGNTSGNVSTISILLITLFTGFAILINNTISLVEYTDIALIIVLLLVSSSAFIDKYNKKEINIIDGASSAGFLSVLILAIQNHFL